MKIKLIKDYEDYFQAGEIIMVYGIINKFIDNLGYFPFYLVYSENNNGPLFVNAEMFVIVDGKIPSCWEVAFNPDKINVKVNSVLSENEYTINKRIVFSYPELGSFEHEVNLWDMGQNHKIFMERKREIDTELS
ncbi:MAG: hypothetical protein OHK0017_13940 [Patescibacteria group bacterium]